MAQFRSLYYAWAFLLIRHIKNEKGIVAENSLATVPPMRIVTGDVLVSYWPIFSPSLVTVAEVFGKINLTQFKLLLV